MTEASINKLSNKQDASNMASPSTSKSNAESADGKSVLPRIISFGLIRIRCSLFHPKHLGAYFTFNVSSILNDSMFEH